MPDDTRILAAEGTDAQSSASWIMAIVTLAAGVLLVWKAGFAADSADAPFWLWIMAAIFGLGGLSLLKKLMRDSLDRSRYGEVTLRLEGPAHPGGRLVGTITIGSPGVVRQLTAKLSCEETVWSMVRTKNGDGDSESRLEDAQTTLWGSTDLLEADAQGRLRVDFSLPPELPVSAYPGSFGAPTDIETGRKYCRWRLRLRSDAGWVGLRRNFVIPVGARPDS